MPGDDGLVEAFQGGLLQLRVSATLCSLAGCLSFASHLGCEPLRSRIWLTRLKPQNGRRRRRKDGGISGYGKKENAPKSRYKRKKGASRKEASENPNAQEVKETALRKSDCRHTLSETGSMPCSIISARISDHSDALTDAS